MERSDSRGSNSSQRSNRSAKAWFGSKPTGGEQLTFDESSTPFGAPASSRTPVTHDIPSSQREEADPGTSLMILVDEPHPADAAANPVDLKPTQADDGKLSSSVTSIASAKSVGSNPGDVPSTPLGGRGVSPSPLSRNSSSTSIRSTGSNGSIKSTGSQRMGYARNFNGKVITSDMMRTTSGKMTAALADTYRHGACFRTRVMYSASMDRDRLKRLYCMFGVCNEKTRDYAASRSFVDVYGNGVMVNAPTACCCFYVHDKATFHYFDDSRIQHIAAAGCCSPFPWLCPHWFNCCGEAIAISRCGGCPLGMGHWCCSLPCLCPTDVIAGLESGEGKRLATHISIAKAQYSSGDPVSRMELS